MTTSSTALRILPGILALLALVDDLSSQKELRVLSKIPFYDVSQMLDAGAVSKDGSVIAQGGTSLYGTDVYIQIWDRKTGSLKRTIPTKQVVALALAPNGRILAAADGGDRIRLWNTKSGKPIRNLAGHTAAVVSLAFSPDGSKIASSAEDRVVKIWQSTRAALLATTPRTKPCARLVFSPDSTLLAGCDKKGAVTVWQVGEGKPLAVLPSASVPSVIGVDFAPDGASVYCGAGGSSVARYRVNTAELISKHEFAVKEAEFFRVSPDGNVVVMTAPPGSITAWKADGSQKIRELLPHWAVVADVVFSADGKWLVSFSKPGYGRLFDTSTFAPPPALQTWWNRGSALCYSHKGRVLAAGSGSGEVHIWDTKKPQVIRRFEGHRSPVRELRFSPDDKALVSSDNYGHLCIWSCGSGALIRRIESPGKPCLGFALTREGSMLLAAWAGGRVERLDVRTGKPMGEIAVSKSDIVRMVVSPDNRLMAASCADKSIIVVDLNTDTQIARFEMKSEKPASSLAFDWRRQHLAASTYNDRVVVFSLSSKAMVFERKAKAFGSLLCLHNKNAFVSAIVGGAVQMFRVPGGDSSTCFTVEGLASFALAVSSDGKQFATALGDGSLRTMNIR